MRRPWPRRARNSDSLGRGSENRSSARSRPSVERGDQKARQTGSRYGAELASISDLAFYHVSAKPVSNQARKPRLIRPKSLWVTPGTSPTSPEVVTVVFPHVRKVLRSGRYLPEIVSGNSGNRAEDAAGNALDIYSENSFGRVRLRITTMV
jgi:hypothetical protein